MGLQTQLQNGGDALALAGAAELDRLPDAEDRAIRAIHGLLANSSLFGTGLERTVQVASVQFLSEIPPTDDAPMSGAVVAADPAHPRFVALTVKPLTFTTLLPASLFCRAS